MGVAIVVMGGAFALYYKSSQNQIAELNQEVAIHKVEAATAKANNEAMRSQIAAQTEALGSLAEEQKVIREQSLRVADIFSKHDLDRLASAKPGLIERRINDGTEAVLDELRGME
jgi:hypothetical protein